VDGGQLSGLQPGIATLIPGLAQQFAALASVARSSVSIVLQGETGTGKGVTADAIHSLSGRRGPLVPLNCGALTPTLVQSELFGSAKRAFSGAAEDRVGLVRSADHGTLFLDEIGDLAPLSQVAILRAIEEKQVTPVGATQAVDVDLRVCSATHRDLASLVA